MFMDLLIYMQMFLMSMLLLMMLYKYILMVLMLMELVVINISLLLFMLKSGISMEVYFIYYLVFSVGEGVLGLSLMVNIVRMSGNSVYYMFNLSKFYDKILFNNFFYIMYIIN